MSTKYVHTIPALDEMLDRALVARAQSDDAFRSALGDVMLRPRELLDALPADANSEIYRAAQLRLYEALTQRTYDVTREETTFNHAELLRWPFPYVTRSPATVGHYLMTYGQIIKEMDLAPGAHILEMGSGYGPLTYEFASMGYRVTCADISADLLAYIRARCADLPGRVDTVQCDMNAFAIDGVYDAIVFFESFHHVLKHVDLVQRIGRCLDDDGILVFAGEPIVPDNSDIVPYPWGLRMDGMSLWAIRRDGWLELGFRISYFSDLLRKNGWDYRRIPSVSTPGSDIWICRRAKNATVIAAKSGETLRIWRADDASILSQCGVRDADAGTIRSQQCAGYLAYGPYAPLEAGTYEVVWQGSYESEAPGAVAEVACDKGQTLLREARADRSDDTIARARFHLREPIGDIEFRLRIAASDNVTLKRIELRLASQHDTTSDSTGS